jgi:hypothetical protein
MGLSDLIESRMARPWRIETDWGLIGFNPFSSKSEGSDHQKKNDAGAKFRKAGKSY